MQFKKGKITNEKIRKEGEALGRKKDRKYRKNKRWRRYKRTKLGAVRQIKQLKTHMLRFEREVFFPEARMVSMGSNKRFKPGD